MLLLKVKNTNICVCVFKQKNGLYGVTSCDSEGHEGLLAEGLLTLKELEDLLADIFNSKCTCCGTFKSTKQLTRVFKCDENLLV